jgi:hypothetical protein
VTDLLLITDVPRLRKIFSRLTDSKTIHLRIANNLEKGAEELAAVKPDVVFVQTHLSGLSAEIILMHLKKQLGRKRSRFVLLASPEQAGEETLRLYQGHIDTSSADEILLYSIRDTINALLTKPAKKTVSEPTAIPDTSPETVAQPVTPITHVAAEPAITTPAVAEPVTSLATIPEEPSLEEQGITYSPRSRLSVYSEFNSSFDSAVGSLKTSTLDEAAPEQHHDWSDGAIETIEAPSERSKRATFLLWLAPVVIAVIVVTILQHKRSTPATLTPATKPPPALASAVAPAPGPAPPAAKLLPEPTVTTAAPVKPAAVLPVAEPNPALSDKAVIKAIGENRDTKKPTVTPVGASRPTALPDFIPSYALDKNYGKSNPGWERYKGRVTEFKVFREGTTIKAIQVLDRGGEGVPESFMKAAVRQVSKNPAVVMEATEKKEGYEIQRGQTADNLKVMFYRDDQGGKLRAFVLTWN